MGTNIHGFCILGISKKVYIYNFGERKLPIKPALKDTSLMYFYYVFVCGHISVLPYSFNCNDHYNYNQTKLYTTYLPIVFRFFQVFQSFFVTCVHYENMTQRVWSPYVTRDHLKTLYNKSVIHMSLGIISRPALYKLYIESTSFLSKFVKFSKVIRQARESKYV